MLLARLAGALVLFSLLLQPSRGNTQLLPSTDPNPLEGVIRTVYPNGLVMLSKEVHASPVVSVWTYYRVGSRDEVQGIFGISHQVEHMMFKGTDQLHPGDIDRLFSERGGQNDAMTTQDYTAYYETLPSSAIDVALKVEADRMERSAMDPAQLAHERNVVLSEIEGDENSPLYKLDTAVVGAAFRAHPYHNPIGGYVSDIHTFTAGEVRHYYNTHYAPQNAVLVVVGDFNTMDLRRKVGAYFSMDRPREVAHHAISVEPAQDGERRVNVEGIGQSKYVEIAYHVPQTGAPDHYVMDVISTVLGLGRSSRLYRELVEKGLATEIDAGDPDQVDPYLMTIVATVAQGHTQAEVETAIEAELDRLKNEPVSATELQKAITQVRASYVYRKDSDSSRAGDLGVYAATVGEGYLGTYLPRIEAVTPVQIQAAANRYFGPENRTVGWFVPRAPRPGEQLPSSGRNTAIHYHFSKFFHSPKLRILPNIPSHPAASHAPAWIARRRRRVAPADEVPFTFSFTPPPISTRPAAHPPVTRTTLPNGMVVIVYPNHNNADISISGSLKAGAFADPDGKAGVANLTAAMLNRGTTHRTEDQLASELDNVAATVGVTAGGSGTFFEGHCLTANLPLVLDILSDELQNPSFSPEIFARVRNEVLTSIAAGEDDPGTVASEQLYATLYPENYPLHWPLEGVANTVNRITVADLKAFHTRYYRPDLSAIVIVGDIDPPAAIQLAQRYFGGWKQQGPTPDTEPASLPGQPAATRVVKTIPDKTEEVVAMGFRGISRNDPRYYAADLMNLILGSGDFNSRLMRDVRDRRGLVYYVGSAWNAGLVAGPWTLQMESNPKDADQAIQVSAGDIQRMQRAGATPAEMRLFKSWVAGSQALQLESDSGIAGGLMQAEYYGLGMDYLWRYPALIAAVTLAEIQSTARDLLRPENLVVSMAGPATH